ncbi:MAG: 23S rRNA (adenine(2503)-C(2))-methyltransferase RlmN [Thermoflexaceae bacterium]|nr:23S rRNA (adenine(2503)-C(2))-methyltransferase RlmN [Thermoflexaceae bacterium]
MREVENMQDVNDMQNIQDDRLTDIKSLNLEELTEFIAGLGEAKFRGKQIYDWMHVKKVESLDEMGNVPGKLKEKLRKETRFVCLKPVDVLISQIDGTRKYLFGLHDGNVIESVFMRYKHGNSVCISSQVGCRMGCRFCASTLDGLTRNLTPSEMLEQIYAIERHTGERVSNVVVMGSGEPMDNYDNLLKFIELLTDVNGINISQRNLTVSTCGIVPKINELAKRKFQMTLAISLHASSDEQRKELMPVANAFSIEEIMNACRNYFENTGRRITFEYSLVQGVNDRLEDSERLSRLLKGLNCHVNLIPVNPIKERNYRQSTAKSITDFKNRLERNGINVTIRREMGRDINGACGQLRKSYMDKRENQ